MSIKIAPSVLSADFLNLEKDIEMLNRSEADWIHFDVMDGVFVPNISFGIPILKAVGKIAEKPLDVHLMIVNPDKYLQDFKDAGANWISVHYETCNHLHRTVNAIKSLGCKAGVVLNPHTPVMLLEDIVNDLDYVLLMSVNPGFGGQSFIPNILNKITSLKAMIERKKANCLIEVDGGVNVENIVSIHKAGADVVVAGNAVFKSENPMATISKMKNI